MDRLEADLKGRTTVLRIDLLSQVGRAAAQDYGVTLIPTVLVFDGQGQVILQQIGMIDATAISTTITTHTTQEK